MTTCRLPSPPALSAMVPNFGYPRQLLAVDGTTDDASVVWDVGLPTEITLTNGLFGTSYFQIPDTAIPGVHPVAIRNSGGVSAAVTVTVLPPSGVFPPPQIKSFGIANIQPTSFPFSVDLALVVTGANLDVDATVTVNNRLVQAWRWGALPVDYLQNHIPATFGYPIYHYTQLLCIVENVALGSKLTVVVTNSDGQTDTGSYRLPLLLGMLDSDGDGLPDTWEEGVYMAPSGGTVNLAALGTHKLRKDILVEVDWVEVATPNPAIWALIETAFANAPVLNPDGSRGIHIIIDRGQGDPFTGGGDVLPEHTTMDFGPSTVAGYTDFFTYKETYFDDDRLHIFHYAVLGRASPDRHTGKGEVWGNDLMVTFATFPNFYLPLAQAGVFMHEFGHNLGLTHGDNYSDLTQRNETHKPNFPSSMNYRYLSSGVSIDCDFVSEMVHTYSQGMFATIDESTVDENIGICDNTPLDMNEDGAISAGVLDTSADSDTTDVHDDFDQWHNLLFDFDALGSRWNQN